MTVLGISLMAGAFVWALMRSSVRTDARSSAQIAALLPAGSTRKKNTRAGPVARLGRRFALKDGAALTQSLAEAGVHTDALERYRGMQIVFAALGATLGLFAGTWALIFSPALGFAGYHALVISLKVRGRSRHDAIASGLPDVADMLSVCTEAGLNIALALRRVAERTDALIGVELRRTIGEIGLGTPRAEALQRLATRVDIPDVHNLVQTIVTAERFGTQVASSLNSYASDLRSKRRRAAEEHARKAPIKILFPLVFLILPAFILLTVAPLLLGTFQDLGF